MVFSKTVSKALPRNIKYMTAIRTLHTVAAPPTNLQSMALLTLQEAKGSYFIINSCLLLEFWR